MRIILLICILWSMLPAADTARVAVLPIQVKGVSAKMAASVTELIASEVNGMEGYGAIPADEVSKAGGVASQALSALVPAGQKLKADLVISGSIIKAGDGYTVALQFADLINREVIKAVKDTRPGTEMDLYNVLGALMIELFGKQPSLEDLSYRYGVARLKDKTGQTPAVPAAAPGKAAVITIKNVPDQAVILVNSRFAGLGAGAVTVPAGDVRLKVRAEHYETFDQIETVRAGEKKTIDANLYHTMATFRVTSEPAGAAVSLSGKKMGTTDLYVPHLKPGPYDMTVELTDYKKIAQKITADKNVRLKYAFTLERTPEYLLRQKKKRMMIRKVAFGTLAAAFAGAGYVMDGKVRSVNDEQDRIYDEYNSTAVNTGGQGGDYGQFKEDWNGLSADADKYILLRTIMYLLSGASAAGMGVSFVF